LVFVKGEGVDVEQVLGVEQSIDVGGEARGVKVVAREKGTGGEVGGEAPSGRRDPKARDRKIGARSGEVEIVVEIRDLPLLSRRWADEHPNHAP
jgi:hypothetical protein